MSASIDAAIVNSVPLDPVEITRPDEELARYDGLVEDIEDEKWSGAEHQNLYPCEPRFRFSYECYLSHVSKFWGPGEFDPMDDVDKFARADPKFREIVLKTAACIHVGDKVVVDKLQMTVTPAAVRLMMISQEDRENTHKIVYSKWLDLDPVNAAWYRSLEFQRAYMPEFEELAERYATSRVCECLYFIMLCEYVMFSPFFLVINYTAIRGYAPRIGEANLMAMKDEYDHYVHCRGLLAASTRRVGKRWANRALDEMCEATLAVARRVIGDYDDGTFNYEHARAHVLHIVHTFRYDNRLYEDEAEFERWNEAYGTTPAESYLTMNQNETKINLMESSSTSYVNDCEYQTVDMNF